MNVSTLIEELEARKNDYILVADVIGAMANATNSAPDEVVKYLDAHDIDAHLTVFYMGENYSFYQYNGFLVNVGNDANTTYFRKSDVVAFEPITKHGIFKDGGNDHLKPYQKNLDDDYLTLDEVVTTLNREVDMFCDYNKIRDLARKKKITPCFYFNGYVCKLIQGSLGGLTPDLMENPYTEIMTGYFTYRLLVEQISSQDDYITLPSCEVGNEILIYRLLERQGSTKISYGDGLALFEGKPKPFDDYNNTRKKFSCIGFDEIRFSKQELDDYIASTQTTSDNHFIEHVKLVEGDKIKQLESVKTENDKLNARLNKASEIYRQNKSEIEELKAQLGKANADRAKLKEQLSNKIDAPADDTILQTILDDSRGDHAPDLKHAIQLWIDLYIHGGIKDDSHSSKANIWIRSNTNYAENANSSIGRIREIATPLKDFGAKRSREEEK